jgi:hypothetical protein
VNTENKKWWCAYGAEKEKAFIAVMKGAEGYSVVMNPEKVSNPYALDLLINGATGDLKVQETPFFTCWKKGHDPQYCVSFNHKDLMRYQQYGHEVEIFFWVNWIKLTDYGTTVKQMHRIYLTSISGITEQIRNGSSPSHEYQRRVNDQLGNAKSSCLLDLRKMTLVKDLLS